MAAGDTEHVAPACITTRSLSTAEQKQSSVNELCSAVEKKTAGFQSREGAQRIGELWHLYPTKIDT